MVADSDRAAGAYRALLRQLLRLALPIAIGGVAQTSYQLVNAFWVGRLGADAVAVVSVCFPVNLVIVSLASGMALAGSIMVAQHHGAGNKGEVVHHAAQTLTSVVILGVFLAVVAYLAAPTILKLLGSGVSIFTDSVNYLRVTLFGTVFVFLSSAYQSILRGIGEARAPLRIIFAAVVTNAMLDPLLIFGWGPVAAHGVAGAAVATIITQCLAAIAGLWLMLRPRFGLSLAIADLKPRWSAISSMYRLGIPASVEQTMQALTVTVMTVLVARYGNVALAGYGMAFRLLTFSIIPIFGMGTATAVMVGQSAGGGNSERARRITLAAAGFNALFMAMVAVALLTASRTIVSVFVPTDPELVRSAAGILQILALSFPLAGINMALSGAFRGAGKTFVAMLMTLCGIWVVQLPSAYLLSTYTALGEAGLWWASVIASAANVLIGWAYFRSGRWSVGAVSIAVAKA